MENAEHNEKKYYFSSDLCRMFSITRKTLFYYDKAGLLKPVDRIGQIRIKVYDEEGYNRMEKILQYRDAGLRIEEIRLLMNGECLKKTEIFEKALDRLEKDFALKRKEIENLHQLIKEQKDNANTRNQK
ncbi:MAG: MerR family transcriptional regulator [Solobacterium sp.]|nr:MerR family transcriptional regulator [Solobacterium sp.]